MSLLGKFIFYKKLLLTFSISLLLDTLVKGNAIDSLLHLLKTDTIKSRQAQLYYEIAWEYYPNDADSMIFYLGFTQKLTEDVYLKAKAIRGEGVAYYLLTDYDKAVESNLKALRLFQELDDLLGVAKCYNSIGLNLSSMKNYQPAIEYHWQSLQIANKLLKNITEADSLLSIKRVLGYNYINLIVSYEVSPQKDSTLFYAQKSIEVFQVLQDSFYLAMSYNRKAQALYMMQDYEASLATNQYVKKEFKNLNPFERTFSYLGLAQNFVELGKINESIDYALKGFKLATDVGAPWHTQHLARVLAKAYAIKGNYKDAYNYQVIYKNYSDSLFNQDNETRINYLLLKQKDLENERLSQINSLKEERLKSKNQQSILYIMGICLLVIFTLVQYHNSKKQFALNQKLSELNEELKLSNASKDKFFSIIAHDLKSPFNSIIGFINLMKTQFSKLSEGEIQKFMDMMLSTTNNTYKLLENLLAWSRLQTGDITFSPTTIKIKELIQENIELMHKVAEEKEIAMHLVPQEEIELWADKNMIGTVLRNLISNAIKFTPRGGQINIDYHKSGKQLKVKVQDTGMGIAEDLRTKLFDVSEKLSTLGTEKEKGTGIGLALSKEFIQKHGGDIEVMSQVDMGSSFIFSLPITAP